MILSHKYKFIFVKTFKTAGTSVEILYESLLEGLGQTFRELAVPFEGSLGVNAKSDYRKDRRQYREVYTDAQASLVGDVFAHEISLHGYEY